MAVKGSASVTLSKYRDTDSVTRYYKLQPSPLAAPDKPASVKPNETPEGWSKSEPECDITMTLYTCDVSVFSDGTTHVSDVSKSSSYEAAKEAWNKANNAQGTANEAKKYTDNALNNYGYQYSAEIEVAGDPNTYYPVLICGPSGFSQNVMREILVLRGIADKCPSDWGGHPETHSITLTAKIKCNFGGWGGVSYNWQIHDLNEMYGHVFAGCELCAAGMAFTVFLRGGGAKYYMYSDMRMDAVFPYNPATSEAPSIWYQKALIGWSDGTADNPKYTFYSPEPRTYTQAVIEEIKSKKYIELAGDAYENADKAQNTADKAQSSADKAQNTATEAAKKADNYISSDSFGIMVSENTGEVKESPQNATKNNVLITEHDVRIRNGQKILASYGESTTIGDLSGGNINVSPNGIELNDGTYMAASIKTIIEEEEDITTVDSFDGQAADNGAQSGRLWACTYSLESVPSKIKSVTLTGPSADSIFLPNAPVGWYGYTRQGSNITVYVDGSYGDTASWDWSVYDTVTIVYTKAARTTGVITSDEVYVDVLHAGIAKAIGIIAGERYDTSKINSVQKRLIIGSRKDTVTNANAAAILENGDCRLGGDVYINCNDDSTGGVPLGTAISGTGKLSLTTGKVKFHPKWWRCGNIVQMEVGVLCAGSVASGTNIAAGTITGVPRPIVTTGIRAVSYYGNNSNISYMESNGNFICRNAGADALSKNNDAVGVFTYITGGTLV